VELPSRSTNDETLVGHPSDGEEEEGEGCGLGSIFMMVVLRLSGDSAVGEPRHRERAIPIYALSRSDFTAL